MTGRVGIDLGGLHCIVENKNGVACFQVFGFFFVRARVHLCGNCNILLQVLWSL